MCVAPAVGAAVLLQGRDDVGVLEKDAFLAIVFSVRHWASPRDGVKHLAQFKCLSWKHNCYIPGKSDLIAFGIVTMLVSAETSTHRLWLYISTDPLLADSGSFEAGSFILHLCSAHSMRVMSLGGTVRRRRMGWSECSAPTVWQGKQLFVCLFFTCSVGR